MQYGPYDQALSHTGRELELMLAGKKPFASFSDLLPIEFDDIIPEAHFEPYVASGRFLKKTITSNFVGADGSSQQLYRVMYAVPGEELRFKAYATLWSLGDLYGWNEGFEKMEGYLLGYETKVDPFFKK